MGCSPRQSDAPEGHARWSLRLLAEKVVEAGFCETISHTMRYYV